MLFSRVSDPHQFHADLDPGFDIFADPDSDPGFEICAHLDPGFDFSKINVVFFT